MKQIRAAMLGELGADQSEKVIEAAIKEADAILAEVEKIREQREKKKKIRLDTFPPPGSLLARWMEVLGDLELQLLEVTRELTAVLKGKSDQNLFDLLATVNQLLDVTAKLHLKVDTILRYTMNVTGKDVPVTEPFVVYPRILLGERASETHETPYPLRKV